MCPAAAGGGVVRLCPCSIDAWSAAAPGCIWAWLCHLPLCCDVVCGDSSSLLVLCAMWSLCGWVGMVVVMVRGFVVW